MSGVSAGSGWFFERGNLHDAYVIFVRIAGNIVEIGINDEWANERGLSKPENEENPCTLKFTSATVIMGIASEAIGAWISEVQSDAEGNYRFFFTDCDPMIIRASSAVCEAGQ